MPSRSSSARNRPAISRVTLEQRQKQASHLARDGCANIDARVFAVRPRVHLQGIPTDKHYARNVGEICGRGKSRRGPARESNIVLMQLHAVVHTPTAQRPSNNR